LSLLVSPLQPIPVVTSMPATRSIAISFLMVSFLQSRPNKVARNPDDFRE
jgi:hypothetical protein